MKKSKAKILKKSEIKRMRKFPSFHLKSRTLISIMQELVRLSMQTFSASNLLLTRVSMEAEEAAEAAEEAVEVISGMETELQEVEEERNSKWMRVLSQHYEHTCYQI